MTMADALIFGIDSNVISIIAEIGVALATVTLAYYTYQSVKTSKETLESLKKQVGIANKELENKQFELEKPQIIDQLQQVLNPFFIKIDCELNQIDENLLLWKSIANGKNTEFFNTTSSEEFYNGADITTQIGCNIEKISVHYPNFKGLCQLRYKSYLSLGDLFTKIYQEINKRDNETKICELIFRKIPPHEDYSGSGYSDWIVTLCDSNNEDPKTMDISSNDFYQTMINIGIAKMLEQRVTLQNVGDHMIVSEFSSNETEIKKLLNYSGSFDSYSKSFNSLIKELKAIDIQLKNEIVKIKMEYREKYHLNDEEYWTSI